MKKRAVRKLIVLVVLVLIIFLASYFINNLTGKALAELNPGEIDTCGEIKSSGEYNLTRDLNGVETCFKIIANNVVLNGKGNVITGKRGGEYGVYILGANNTVVKNLIIKNYTSGMQVKDSFNSQILDNTLRINVIGVRILAGRGNLISGNNLYDSDNYGIYVDNTNSNLLYNNYIEDGEIGLTFSRGANNIIKNVTLRSPKYNAIVIENVESKNNTFEMINVTGLSSGYYGLKIKVASVEDISIFDSSIKSISTVGSGSKLLLAKRNVGEIKFLREIAGAASNLDSNLIIKPNFVEIKGAALNLSANVTLYDVPSLSNPTIKRDGLVCNATTTPSCWNFTSLTGTVVFNVSGWSNYTISGGTALPPQNDFTSPNVKVISPLNGAEYNRSPILIKVALDEQGVVNYSLNRGATNKTLNANSSNTGFEENYYPLSNGTFTINIYAQDLAGNVNNSVNFSFKANITDFVNPPTTTCFIDEDQLLEGYTKTLSIGDNCTFVYFEENYSLKLRNIHGFNASLEINPGNIRFNISEGDNVEIDADDDEAADIYFEVEDILSNGTSARIYFTSWLTSNDDIDDEDLNDENIDDFGDDDNSNDEDFTNSSLDQDDADSSDGIDEPSWIKENITIVIIIILVVFFATILFFLLKNVGFFEKREKNPQL